MGKPNNLDSQDAMAAVLRKILTSPDHTISEADLRRVEMDVSMLEQMYLQDVRPYLPYLHGYKDLRELDPASHRQKRYDVATKQFREAESWEAVLDRCRVGEHRQVVCIMRAAFYCYQQESHLPENIQSAIFLSREGKWLFWFAETSHDRSAPPQADQVKVFGDFASFWASFTRFVTYDYTIHWESRFGYGSPHHLPLHVAQCLRLVLAHTISEREKRLSSMRDSLEAAELRVANVTFDIN